MNRVGAAVATALRLGLGGRAGAAAARPTVALELYEFESCPFCRKVREALVWFDLDVLVRPCPPGGTRFRPGVGGPFPLLVEDGAPLRGSDAIVRRLAEICHQGHVPWLLRLGPLTTVTCGLASLVQPRVRARPSRAPARPLELFADEVSAEARAIRRWLCEREIPYLWRTCGRGSAKPRELAERTGDARLPALLDEAADLRGASASIAHLERLYAA